jgi:hypothetical protein
MTLYKAKEVPSIMFWNSILTSGIMLGLDKYWEKKCDKVIDEQ